METLADAKDNRVMTFMPYADKGWMCETDARLLAAAPDLLAMLKRVVAPEVSRCEVNRSMGDVIRECGEQNRCEPCRAALEAEALIRACEGEP